MNRFALVRARTVSEAAQAASSLIADAMTQAAGNAGEAALRIVKAGGIDLLDLMKENLLAPSQIVSLRDIPGLDTIAEEKDGGLRIGAMVTLASLASHPLIRQRYAALADVAAGSASPQIRAVATIGGNLLQRPRCWYFRSEHYRCLRKGGGHCFALPGENQYHAVFDNHACAIVHPSTVATILVALGATIELAGPDGSVRRPRLEDFLIGPDRDLQRENDLKPQEIVTAIGLPALSASTRMAHVKQGEKASFDWPLADVAVVFDLAADGTCTSASIVLGAAAPVPHRCRTAERALLGRKIEESAIAAAASAALEGATPLAHNAYKLPLFETLVRRALAAAASDRQAARL